MNFNDDGSLDISPDDVTAVDRYGEAAFKAAYPAEGEELHARLGIALALVQSVRNPDGKNSPSDDHIAMAAATRALQFAFKLYIDGRDE